MYVLHTTVNGTEYFLAHRRLFPVLRDDSSIIPSHHTTTPSEYCTAMYYAGVGQTQMLGQIWFPVEQYWGSPQKAMRTRCINVEVWLI